MKLSQSGLATSTIISAATGAVLITGLVPAAIQASKSDALNPIVKIERILNQGE